jgi:hypothetical protein
MQISFEIKLCTGMERGSYLLLGKEKDFGQIKILKAFKSIILGPKKMVYPLL